MFAGVSLASAVAATARRECVARSVRPGLLGVIGGAVSFFYFVWVAVCGA
jgi:hypothetical protein